MKLINFFKVVFPWILFSGYAYGQQTINKVNVNELTLPKLEAGKVLVIDGDKKAVGSLTTTSIELDNLAGSTGNIQSQINSKEPIIPSATTSDYYRGDKSFQPLNKAAVGLSNADNTTDLNKPISTATQTALNLKADDSGVVHKTGNENVAGEKTFTDPLVVTSTTKGSSPCPVMTDAQMLAIVSPQNGRCVYNSTKKAPYFYSSTDSKWKLSGGGGGGGGGGGIEQMIDPSFEDGVTSDYTGLSGATVSQIASTMPGTFNEKMMRIAFTSSGSITFNKTTGSGYTGATAKVGGFFKPVSQSDVTFEPLINGVHDGRQCALPAGVWTYCFFELPAHLHPGWRLTSPTSTTHNVDVEWTTISISEKFSALVNLSNITEWQTYTPTWTVVSGTNPAIGNGTITGKWRRVGENAEINISITSGTTTTYGTGVYLFSVPPNLTIDTAKSNDDYGTFNKYNNTGSFSTYIGKAIVGSSTQVRVIGTGVSLWKESVPATLTASTAGHTITSKLSIPIVGWTASSPNIVMSNETFSTDTAALFHKSTACLSTEIGCFNTYSYAINSNTRTICATAPTQTIASMNTNGIQIFTRAYNAASTCASPARVEVMIGKNAKNYYPATVYKSTGKLTEWTPGFFENGSGFVTMYGVWANGYESSTGMYTFDAGATGASITTHQILFKDLSASTSGYLVIDNSKNPAMSGITLPSTPTITRLTSGSGTYTLPTDVKYIKIKMIGGGGGGQGSTTSGWAAAAGNGGTTTFGTSLLSAPGGVGGNIQGGDAVGAATAASPAVLLFQSFYSGLAGVSRITTVEVASGTGGQSPFGGAGKGIVGNGPGISGQSNTGSGAGGGSLGSGVTGTHGAGGGSGAYLEAIIKNPLSSYTYAIGAGGTAGAAGTGGQAGGTGGSGIIIVEEYY